MTFRHPGPGEKGSGVGRPADRCADLSQSAKDERPQWRLGKLVVAIWHVARVDAVLPGRPVVRVRPIRVGPSWRWHCRHLAKHTIRSRHFPLTPPTKRGRFVHSARLGGRFTIARGDEFVPVDFDVPRRLETPQFVLEPLGPEHNDRDYDAWTSSVTHIHATPGWEDSRWPREMTPDENRADLQRHADDFRNRTGFTYTVLDPASRDVIGCVYIYPLRDSEYDARALSWVRASHAQLDAPLWRAVSEWLSSEWPFARVDYAPRA